jgi:tRNA threonylcarbamoyladenosine biosynthesis protein TsaE
MSAAARDTPSPSSFPLSISSASTEQTRFIGARLGALLSSGEVVLLGGELGAGKTTLTQGLARGLGVKEQVTSPTFTLIRCYDSGPGQLKLLHADMYRLENVQEIIDLGLPELLEEGAVAVVEWGEQAAPALPPDYLEIQLEFVEGEGSEDQRRLRLRPMGSRWAARFAGLRRSLVPEIDLDPGPESGFDPGAPA